MSDLHWYDPYSGHVISDEARDEKFSDHPFYKKHTSIKERALEYERLTTQEVFDRLVNSLHETVQYIGKDKFQEIMQAQRPDKH